LILVRSELYLVPTKNSRSNLFIQDSGILSSCLVLVLQKENLIFYHFFIYQKEVFQILVGIMSQRLLFLELDMNNIEAS